MTQNLGHLGFRDRRRIFETKDTKNQSKLLWRKRPLTSTPRVDATQVSRKTFEHIVSPGHHVAHLRWAIRIGVDRDHLALRRHQCPSDQGDVSRVLGRIETLWPSDSVRNRDSSASCSAAHTAPSSAFRAARTPSSVHPLGKGSEPLSSAESALSRRSSANVAPAVRAASSSFSRPTLDGWPRSTSPRAACVTPAAEAAPRSVEVVGLLLRSAARKGASWLMLFV